jgi:hypothetical protein
VCITDGSGACFQTAGSRCMLAGAKVGVLATGGVPDAAYTVGAKLTDMRRPGKLVLQTCRQGTAQARSQTRSPLC